MWGKNSSTTKCKKCTTKCDIEKSKGITQFDKRTVICDIETTYCEDGTVKREKKKSKGTAKCKKKLLHVMLELHNVRIEPSNVRKK